MNAPNNKYIIPEVLSHCLFNPVVRSAGVVCRGMGVVPNNMGVSTIQRDANVSAITSRMM